MDDAASPGPYKSKGPTYAAGQTPNQAEFAKSILGQGIIAKGLQNKALKKKSPKSGLAAKYGGFL
jgi:hypothetical protein